jgi:exosome complex component RRP41
MALADAGIPMKDLVSSVSVGLVGNTIVVDLNKEEEDYEEGSGSVDIPISMTPRTNEITLLQLDGKISKDKLFEALQLGKKACYEIYKVQQKALKEDYSLGVKNE